MNFFSLTNKSNGWQHCLLLCATHIPLLKYPCPPGQEVWKRTKLVVKAERVEWLFLAIHVSVKGRMLVHCVCSTCSLITSPDSTSLINCYSKRTALFYQLINSLTLGKKTKQLIFPNVTNQRHILNDIFQPKNQLLLALLHYKTFHSV